MDAQTDTQTDGRDFWSTPLRWAQVPWYIYIPSFLKIGSAIQKLMGGDSQSHRQQGDLISLLLFFQNNESRLITLYVCLLQFKKQNLFNCILHMLVLHRCLVSVLVLSFFLGPIWYTVYRILPTWILIFDTCCIRIYFCLTSDFRHQ
jgi:hypothetical protein